MFKKLTTTCVGLALAACSAAPTEAPHAKTNLGAFVLAVDPAAGTAELTMLGETGRGIYGPVPFAQDGNTATNPPNTVQAVTEIALPESSSQGGLVCPAAQNCFRVRVTSFFNTQNLSGLYMAFDNIVPATNHTLLNSDPNPGLASGGAFGGVLYGDLAPGGSAARDLFFTAPSATPYQVFGHFEADDTTAVVPFVNGSFETGDYTGWTLLENTPVDPLRGAWGIGTAGVLVTDPVFDFADGVNVPATCMGQGVPSLFTPTATDGTRVAFNTQTNPQTHRMFQTVTVPAAATDLVFDFEYVAGTAIDPTSERLAVHVRDPNTDAILATPFIQSATDPTAQPMTETRVDLSTFAGQAVRVDFELVVNLNCFHAAFDDVRFESP